jgi:hypothetical protein
MTDPTAITHHDGGTTMTGDAIELYRWKVVQQSIGLYMKTGMLMTRGATITHLLTLASGITKKQYGRGKKAQQQAYDDLQVSIETLRAAIPHVDETTKPKL